MELLQAANRRVQHWAADFGQWAGISDPPCLGSPVTEWPLMSTVAFPISICVVYVAMTSFFGPRIMANRYPIRIELLTTMFNWTACTLNVILGVSFSVFMVRAGYSVLCQPALTGCRVPDIERNIAILGWCYHVMKIAQLTDGAISVMRLNQIPIKLKTHHCVMVLASWAFLRNLPGGTSAIFATINCFSHALVYGYYEFSQGQVQAVQVQAPWPLFHTVRDWVTGIQFGSIGLVAACAYVMAVWGQCKYPEWASGTVAGVVLIFGAMAAYEEMWVKRRRPPGGGGGHGGGDNDGG